MSENNKAAQARMRLVEVGGRTSQDLGLGRIVGEILMYLYLREDAQSLDRIEKDLKLSKAAVSVVARQLESLGLLRRVWKRGDRKSYYRTAENLATALQHGLLGFVRQKVDAVAAELEQVDGMLVEADKEQEERSETAFLRSRVRRAREMEGRLEKILKSPLLKVFVR